MIIEADARQLEFRVAMWLSQDEIGIKEIVEGLDIHEDNRIKFNLPTRLIAKTYIFRLLYGGSAYSYSADPDFSNVSTSVKFWEGVIEETYKKYYGLGKWHRSLMTQATTTGQILTPTGRIYKYEPKLKRGDWEWPRTDILNYIVQGMAAEFMAIARVTAYRRYQNEPWKDKVKFINTVHDSILLDTNLTEGTKEWYNICIWLEKVFEDIPVNFQRMFKKEVNVPFAGEIKYGDTWGTMKDFKREECKCGL